MARITCVAPHLTLEQVKQKMHSATSTWLRNRWLIIYTAMLTPRPAHAIAAQLGVSRPFVARITSLYTRFGPPGLETIGWGGRRNAYLSPDEETAFLAPFLERAAQSDIVTTKVIHHAFEQHIGCTVMDTSIADIVLHAGASRFLRKPFAIHALRQILIDLLPA